MLSSVDGFIAWLRLAPNGTLLSAESVLEALSNIVPLGEPASVEPASPTTARDISWREHLWIAPHETRIGVHEVAEALGRSKSWVYHRIGSTNFTQRIPHRKIDGALCFVVGEIRQWVPLQEEIIAKLSLEIR